MQFSFKKFYTLFIVQFLGAFNDNLFKNALVLLITYRGIHLFGLDSSTLVAFSAGLFILPFFLFSAFAGVLADRYQKIQIAKLVKIAEIVIMAVAAMGFYFDSYGLLLLCLFAMGTHSAFFGPVKYSLIPHYVDEDHLLQANAWVSTGTFVAILGGTILGGVLSGFDNHLPLVFTMILVAVLGLKFALRMEPVEVIDRELALEPAGMALTKKVLKLTMKEKDIFCYVIGISWFWLLGTAILTIIPLLAKVTFSAKEEVATLFLSTFVVGMGFGPFFLEKISKGKIYQWVIPVSLFVMSLFIFDLSYISKKVVQQTFIFLSPEFGIKDFFALDGSTRVLFDLFFISALGGIFTVPQFTMIQKLARPEALSRLIAGNNIWNAIFMVTISIVLMVLFTLKFHLSTILIFIGAANFLVALSLAYFHREEFNRFWRF